MTEEQLLGKCLSASIHGIVGMTLYELKVKDGEIVGSIEVSKKAIEKCKPIFRFTPEHVFLNIEFDFERNTDLLSANYMLENYLTRYTNAIVSDKAEYASRYMLVVDVIGEEPDGYTYVMTCSNPIFFYKEGSVLKMVCPMNSLHYGANKIDYSEVEKEAEYEVRSREEEIKRYNLRLEEDGGFSED